MPLLREVHMSLCLVLLLEPTADRTHVTFSKNGTLILANYGGTIDVVHVRAVFIMFFFYSLFSSLSLSLSLSKATMFTRSMCCVATRCQPFVSYYRTTSLGHRPSAPARQQRLFLLPRCACDYNYFMVVAFLKTPLLILSMQRAAAEALRQQGNELFRAGRMLKAIQCYSKAVRSMGVYHVVGVGKHLHYGACCS